ncbi:MAG: twin-arginine translocase TatA/TatE family subunit [Bacteroidota bacterium]
MGGFGVQEMILIIIAILLLFGGKKIPELMEGLGKGIKEFNNAKNENAIDLHDPQNDTARQ